MLFALLLFTALAALSDGHDLSAVSRNVLVLVENFWIKESHSSFLKILADRGFTTTIKVADDSTLSLMKYGEYTYGHVIILAPSVSEFGGSLNVKEIVNFIDHGGNVVVAASSDVGEAIRELGSECGVEFDERKTAVIDHYNYDIKDDGNHTYLVIPSENLIRSQPICGDSVRGPFLYRGISISADPNNPLLIGILHGTRTSYSYNPSKTVGDYPNTVGTNTQLVVALQARNNARVLFTGSLDFLSNEFFEAEVESALTSDKREKSGNRALAEKLVLWTFGERGQLRVAGVTHHLEDELITPSQYTIMDRVFYSIKVETKDESGAWVPFNADDLQLEFVRIDPFIRRTLKPNNGNYSTVLKLPDVYGVFKFIVDYHRVGYTHLESVSMVPVRPFKHTQYERFIEAAYPYYFSAISMVVGVTLFSFVFLYYKDDKEKSD
ncbi:unnamed protein product [Calicophoron daubneyi]|uniref:Dolichyl-diphosphooligosaccharide--protein glycosyltransferase 48 kDa subunit n=1 Tax=Calicophoron daubneyi TaxID=300641 RepID=A0AAV2TW56_CALDB